MGNSARFGGYSFCSVMILPGYLLMTCDDFDVFLTFFLAFVLVALGLGLSRVLVRIDLLIYI